MSVTRRIVIQNIPYEMFFTKISILDGIKYFVYAESEHEGNYAFNMKKVDNDWKIINAPKVPGIFLNNEVVVAF